MKTLQDIIGAAQKAMHGGPLDIALANVSELENLRPTDIPEVPYIDPELRRHFTGEARVEMSEGQRADYGFYRDAMSARAEAIGENERRLRTALWTEQTLRKHNRPETELVRTFNLEEWGIADPAPYEVDAREALVRGIARKRPSLQPMRSMKPPVPANRNYRGDDDDGQDLPQYRDPTRRTRP